jgi:hypothetical protein
MLAAVAGLALCLAAPAAHANDWERIFTNLAPSNSIIEGHAESEQVYKARLGWTITDGDGLAGNFEGNDQININVRGTGLQFTGSKDGLIAYADAHASQIWAALFGITPGASVTGTSEAQASTSAVISNLTPPAIPSLLARKWTSDVTASGEYNYLEVDGVNVTGSSGIVTYGHTILGPANQIGFAMPYRMLSADDELNTDIDAFQPTFFYKRTIYSGQPVFLVLGVAGFFGVNHFNSDIIEDGYYFRYGANTFVSVGREIYPWLAVFGDLSYEVGKYWAPRGAVPDDIRFIATAINDLPVDHTITEGVRVGLVFIPDWLWGTVQAFRIQAIGEDVPAANAAQTVLMGKLGTQVFNFIYIDVGYKTSFEIPDYDDNTFIFNIRAAF